jgi:GNAT superfamily N-acetyltransferase
MVDFAIRRLQPHDSLDDITSMLHRAFAPMARRGLNCRSANQSVETTRLRVRRGDCFVAVVGGRIVGTITIQAADPTAAVHFYRAADVASVHQFAVDPCFQGTGIGHALLQFAVAWARARQCVELALDTPATADGLRGYYAREGFKPVGLVQVAGRAYPSAVMTKRLYSGPRSATAHAWPARHPAQMAVVALEERRRGGAAPGQFGIGTKPPVSLSRR